MNNEKIAKIAEALRGGRRVSDSDFDQVFSLPARLHSTTHWSPVEVAIRAAELLATSQDITILDVGSGAGKFCLVGALTSPGKFIGVEQRQSLVEEARSCANALKTERASFIHGNMADLDWEQFDAFYLFNPFYENLLKVIRIDDAISHSQERFKRYIELVRSKLGNAPPGTQVATYHGFGGDMPSGYELLRREVIGTSFLELWIKH